MKRDDSFWIGLIALAVVFMMGAICGHCGGAAQRACAQDREPSAVLLLARLCVNESGTRAYTHDDCAAIHAVISFRAERIYRTSYVDALHRYSHRVTVDRTGRGRPWIAELWPDAREPASFPPRARWSGRHGLWWRRSFAQAREIFEGRTRARCAPHTWARADVRPADPSAHRIDCGDTLNVFWSVPAYARRWGDT